MYEQKRNTAVPISVFISYAHEDEPWRQRLEAHLSLLRRQGLIANWHDRQILAGEEWACAIDEHLETALITLLLISSDFLASDYCYGIEMQRALELHKNGQVKVIPIILRPVDWEGAPFAHLQCLPRDARAITEWDNRDAVFRDIVRGIRTAIEQFPLTSTVSQPVPVSSKVPAELVFHPETSIAAEYINKGAVFGGLGRYVENLEAYQQALLLDPHNALAHIGKGNALYNLKQYDEAGPAYHEAILLAPDNVLAYIGRGRALCARDYCDEALVVFEQAIHLDSENIDAYNGKILCPL